jgi:hypothetical protein
MGKPLPSLAVILALILPVAVASEALASTAAPVAGAASAATLYPIPPAHTPAVSVHSSVAAAASYLGTLSPAALAASGGVQLGASASGPGTFTFTITAKVHGKTVLIGTGRKSTGRAGALTIKLTLTKAGKAALAGAGGKLSVTVLATFKPKHGKAKTARGAATLQ